MPSKHRKTWRDNPGFHYIEASYGHLYYRWGTGDNVEITHFKVDEQYRRMGYGRELLVLLLLELRDCPPYATVFGFSLAGNDEAHRFYRSVGFTTSVVGGVYDDGRAVVFSARYEDLCRAHGVPPP